MLSKAVLLFRGICCFRKTGLFVVGLSGFRWTRFGIIVISWAFDRFSEAVHRQSRNARRCLFPPGKSEILRIGVLEKALRNFVCPFFDACGGFLADVRFTSVDVVYSGRPGERHHSS